MKRLSVTLLSLALCSGSFSWCGNSFAQQSVNTNAFRYWTTEDGTKSSVKLKLVENDGNEVTLAREDSNAIVTLPVETLSTADQSYLAKLANKVTIGNPAPDFTVTGIDSKPIKLSDKLASGDKNIVLLFSRAHW